MIYIQGSNVRWLLTCAPFLVICMPSMGCLLASSQSNEKFERAQTLVSSSRYRIVGNNKARALAMAKWLDEELSVFEAEYDVTVSPGGLVFLIEPGEGIPPKIMQWKKQNIVRRRNIAFKGKYTVIYPKGRPYCVSRGEPYFYESFSVPLAGAVTLDLIDDTENPPSWICILTTDAHLLEAYDKLSKKEEKPENIVSAIVRLHSDATYPKIDLGLMRLQRREAVWSTWIRSSDLSNDADQLVAALQKRIDQAYGKLYFTHKSD